MGAPEKVPEDPKMPNTEEVPAEPTQAGVAGSEGDRVYGDCPKLQSIRGPIFGCLL